MNALEEKAPLTKEQIANWRKVLCTMIGPWALIMPEKQVQQMRDRMQGIANESVPKEAHEAK